MDLKAKIRAIPDFPKPGIMFRDITTLLKDGPAFAETIDQLYDYYKDKNVSKVAGIESRGFIFGAPLALRLGCGCIPIRKPGKLPAAKESVEYELEYGTDRIEIHIDAVEPGERVLVIDDLLATGGTAAAAKTLVEKIGAELVGIAFIVELDGLNGRAKLGGCDIFTLIHF
ncbi:MAG: adenine phosphoribosyltransferase [bacterium]